MKCQIVVYWSYEIQLYKHTIKCGIFSKTIKRFMALSETNLRAVEKTGVEDTFTVTNGTDTVSRL